ncbi:MAG: hypothetical protein Q9194_003288 [Teloschistes cf. exilis]
MNGHPTSKDMYFDPPLSRSPSAHRHQQQTLHRQPSRHFDGYGPMPNNMWNHEDSTSRFDGGRMDRMNTNMPGGAYGFDMPSAPNHSWNPSAFGAPNGLPTFGATGNRMKPMPRGRSALPPTWLDQHQMHTGGMNGGMNGGMSGGMNGGMYGGLGPSPLGMSQIRPDQFGEQDEELIPTAIVIKNIPFAVKKEQLVDLMTQMSLPLPYAFNYHFDNGVFRGLAFANFTSADETATVIEHLNHFELQGRKLRVEYKKMLPLQERERIEREKRERRGQLEEQHRPLGSAQLHNQPSMSSLASHAPTNSPSPLSARNEKPDMNDPETLRHYTQLLLFKEDHTREIIIFPHTLTPLARRAVHTIAHNMELEHSSHDTGIGDQRQVHVYRAAGNNISPPIVRGSSIHRDPNGRSLNRAATMDFGAARGGDFAMYNTLRAQQSSGLLGIPDSPGGFGTSSNLRGAKSYADLRSYTPSPVPSSASFPVALQSNIARFQQQDNGNQYNGSSLASNTPTLTSTAPGLGLGSRRSEDMLINGFGGMTIGSNPVGPTGSSPRRSRTMFPWDQENQPNPAGPVGSNRSFSTSNNYDDHSRERNGNVPVRQPRGPAVERGSGFSRGRQNGHQARGSDEMRMQSQPEIIVE